MLSSGQVRSQSIDPSLEFVALLYRTEVRQRSPHPESRDVRSVHADDHVIEEIAHLQQRTYSGLHLALLVLGYKSQARGFAPLGCFGSSSLSSIMYGPVISRSRARAL